MTAKKEFKAFPSTASYGMDLRDWFAGMVLEEAYREVKSRYREDDWNREPTIRFKGIHEAARLAYSLAGQMLYEREHIHQPIPPTG